MPIDRMTPADFGDVAKLIEAHNTNPLTQCLHSGEHADEIEALFHKHGALHYWLLRENGEWAGVLGCEVEKERGYLHGPFIAGSPFAQSAQALWHALQATLPSLERWDSFLNVRNEQGAAFYLEHGFRRGQGAQIYGMPAAALQPLNGMPAKRFTPDWTESVRFLHELAFADSPLEIEPFMDSQDENRALFIFVQGSRCIGYVAASLNDSPREGSIDLLAVDASVRNQGYGRRLLLTAAHWLIQERGMPRVGLTVRDMRADARQLYQRSGFALLYTGVGYSREQTLPRRQL